MPDSSRRALYRIVYPLAERPTLLIGRHVYEIVDCSEAGLRYEVKGRRLPVLGTELGGTIEFRRGEELEISGQVIRAQEEIVVLALNPPGVPFGEVLAEQRYLRSKGYTLRE